MNDHKSYVDKCRERLGRNNSNGFSNNQRSLVCIALANMYFSQLRDFITNNRSEKMSELGYGDKDSDLKDYALFETENDDELLRLALDVFEQDERSNITSDVELVSAHMALRVIEEDVADFSLGPNRDQIKQLAEETIPGVSEAFNHEMQTALETFPDLKDQVAREFQARLAIYRDQIGIDQKGPIRREVGMM